MLRLHLYDGTTNPFRQLACTSNNQPGIIWTRVANRQDVMNEIARIGGGGQLAELWLHLHGSPGIVRTQDVIAQRVAFDANNVHLLRNVCLNAMDAFTWVYWLCGNLGEGPAGDAFLRAAGPAMLSRGGMMLASTSVVYPLLRSLDGLVGAYATLVRAVQLQSTPAATSFRGSVDTVGRRWQRTAWRTSPVSRSTTATPSPA